MKYFFVLLTLTFVSCGHMDDMFECTLGDLQGVYTAHYTYVSGTCGYLNSETVRFPTTVPGCSSKRVYLADTCSLLTNTVCETRDRQGYYSFNFDIGQTTTITFKGSLSLEVVHPNDFCFGLYIINMHKVSD